MTVPAPDRPNNAWCALLAGLCSLLLFAGLPLLESLVAHDTHPPEAHELHAVAIVPPPPPPPSRPEQAKKTPDPPRPPDMEKARPLIPIRAKLRLDMSIHDIAADFAPRLQVERPSLAHASSHVLEQAEIDHPPLPVMRMSPIYPPRARARGIDGEVQVEFVVGTLGKVHGAVVVHAEPPGVFEAAALRAVRRWRFQPGTKGEEPVPVRVRQRLEFSLGR